VDHYDGGSGRPGALTRRLPRHHFRRRRRRRAALPALAHAGPWRARRSRGAKTRRVGHVVAASLIAHGAALIRCVPGESYLGLTDAITDRPQLRLVVCRHEGGASYMAGADGRMRGGTPGMCLVSRGPGVANAMIGLHTAHHDPVPMLPLIGQVDRREMGLGALQEKDCAKLLADTTKAAIRVDLPAQAAEAMARAFHPAAAGTPGPVAVVLPEDIFDEPAGDVPPAAPRRRAMPEASAAQLGVLADLPARSERLLVHVGSAMDGAPERRADPARLAVAWMLPVSPRHRWLHL
jgi:acetolactate synthase-1/2/3 large subunit